MTSDARARDRRALRAQGAARRLDQRRTPSGTSIRPASSYIGGPDGDCGLTGRKIIVDTYGGAAPHGGGAFSGKDPTKVDRSAAYAARYLAKNVVAAGLADRCTIQLSYAIGVAEAAVDLRRPRRQPEQASTRPSSRSVLGEVMDLSPRGIRQHLDLNKPIYARTSAYGHFGREPDKDGGFSWEKHRPRRQAEVGDGVVVGRSRRSKASTKRSPRRPLSCSGHASHAGARPPPRPAQLRTPARAQAEPAAGGAARRCFLPGVGSTCRIPAGPPASCSRRRPRRVARDRLRRRRAPALAGGATSERRPDRLRAVRGRRRQGAERHRGARSSPTSACMPTTRARCCAGCPTACDRPRVHPVSRSLAQEAPPQAPARVRGHAAPSWPASCAPGAELRIATDIGEYARWILLAVPEAAQFPLDARRARATGAQRPADWPPTRYEQKALGEGRRCYYSPA